MNATHLHLMLNHLPVLGTAFGLGLLLFGAWRRSSELKKTAFGVFVLVTLATAPVYLTGEPAEDGVSSLPGVSKPVMEQHEGAAGAAFTAVFVLGVASLAGLIRFRRGRELPAPFVLSVLVMALVASVMMAWTANLGGQIRHSEIRAGSAQPGGAIDQHH